MGHQIEIAVEGVRNLAVDYCTGLDITRFIGLLIRVWDQANVVSFRANDVGERGSQTKSCASTCSGNSVNKL